MTYTPPGYNHPWRDRKCRSGKMTFQTSDEARLWASGRDLETRPYWCPDCAHWHLTRKKDLA